MSKLSKKTKDKIDLLCERFPEDRKRSAVIGALHLVQHENKGYLTAELMNEVADHLVLPTMHVYEVATFYSMFNLEPVGENFVQICRTTPCWLRGSDKLVEVAKEVSNTKLGETSDDKKFTIVEVECLGACCNAPMVQINDDYYEDLNEDSFKKLLTDLKQNKEIKKGSQIGRQTSHPQREKNA